MRADSGSPGTARVIMNSCSALLAVSTTSGTFSRPESQSRMAASRSTLYVVGA